MKKKLIYLFVLIIVTVVSIKPVLAATNTVFSNNVKTKKAYAVEVGKGLAKGQKGYVTYTVNKIIEEGAYQTVFEPYLKTGATYINKGDYVGKLTVNSNISTKVELGTIGIGEWKLLIRGKIPGGDICAGWEGKVTLVSY